MRYFLFGRPFRFLTTSGLYFMVLGQSIILTSNTMRQCRQAWPTEPLGWTMWALAVGALGLLALVVQAAAREYARRTDRPRRFWQVPNLLTIGSGEQKAEAESRP